MPDGEAGPTASASVLAARRMCRDFLPNPVDPAVLEPVLRAAFRGPAAGNTDALDLLVLTGADVERYWDITLADGAPRRVPLAGSAARAGAGRSRTSIPQPTWAATRSPTSPRRGLGRDAASWTVPYWWVDGGAAVMAMLLAAEAGGLGALFFGQFDHEPAVASWLRCAGRPPGARHGRARATAPRGRSTSASARRGASRPGSSGCTTDRGAASARRVDR